MLKLNLPFVSAGVEKYRGQVATFNWKKSPSYRDLFPCPPLNCGNCQQQGIVGIVPSLVGQFQALEVIKIITELTPPLAGKLLLIDTLTLKTHIYHYQKQKEPQVKTISFEELKKLSTVELIDVREKHQDHIGGKHIPCAQLLSQLHILDTTKPIVVYCQQGVRSHWAAQLILDHFPHSETYSLEGGIGNFKMRL